MLDQVRVTTLSEYGEEQHRAYSTISTSWSEGKPMSLADIVAALDAQGETIIEARYVR